MRARYWPFILAAALFALNDVSFGRTASEALIGLWADADARCTNARSEADVKNACEERDRVADRLRALNLCYRFKSPSSDASGHWPSCETFNQEGASTCLIADPTSTPLNVRTQPYGVIIGTIANGEHVRLLEEKKDISGNLWVYIEGTKPIGWVYRKYVMCKPSPE